MKHAAIVFCGSLGGSAALTPLLRRFAMCFGFLDLAHSHRKVHAKAVPRLGGVAIVVAFYASLLVMLAARGDVRLLLSLHHRQVLAFGAGGLGIAAIGVYDDIFGSGAKSKFLVQFLVAGLVWSAGIRIEELSVPFVHFELGLLSLPVTLVWIAGVINAFNLIDGLDGLAGGVALIALVALFVMALPSGVPEILLSTAALGGAVLGFLFFNLRPATIFMGDTGSMFLGFVLATASIQTHHKSSTVGALLVAVVALGVPITDTLLALGRRALRGYPLFLADRGHIHHKLLGLGLSKREVVFVLYAVSVLLGVLAVGLTRVDGRMALALLLALTCFALLALRKLGYLHLHDAPGVLEERRRNVELLRDVRKVVTRLASVREADSLWKFIRSVPARLEASGIVLELVRRDETMRFEALPEQPSTKQFRSRHSLGERRVVGYLELVWTDGRNAIDRSTSIALEVLCEHVKRAVRRIEEASLDVGCVSAAGTRNDPWRGSHSIGGQPLP